MGGLKKTRVSLLRENRELRQRCSMLAQPQMLLDMERTIGQRKKTRAELDELQSTYARIDDQVKNIDSKIRAVERLKKSKDRF